LVGLAPIEVAPPFGPLFTIESVGRSAKLPVVNVPIASAFLPRKITPSAGATR